MLLLLLYDRLGCFLRGVDLRISDRSHRVAVVNFCELTIRNEKLSFSLLKCNKRAELSSLVPFIVATQPKMGAVAR